MVNPPAEVANRLGVTYETVYSLISRGQLKAYMFSRSRQITGELITAHWDSANNGVITVM